MALLAQVTLTIHDGKTRTGFVRFYLPDSAYGNVDEIITEVETYWQEVALRLDVLIGGVITNISVSFNVALPAGLKTMAENDSDIEEKARLVFSATGTAIEGYACEIPTFQHDRFGIFTKLAFSDDSEVDAFTQILFAPSDTAGWTADYGGISDNRGNAILESTVPTLYKKFKKS